MLLTLTRSSLSLPPAPSISCLGSHAEILVTTQFHHQLVPVRPVWPEQGGGGGLRRRQRANTFHLPASRRSQLAAAACLEGRVAGGGRWARLGRARSRRAFSVTRWGYAEGAAGSRSSHSGLRGLGSGGGGWIGGWIGGRDGWWDA